MKKYIVQVLLLMITGYTAFAKPVTTHPATAAGKLDTATFATGCFWCTEAKFQQLEGVKKVTSGFTGGHVPNPSYKLVCTGTTGHAEACNIVYDPAKISYDDELYHPLAMQ